MNIEALKKAMIESKAASFSEAIVLALPVLNGVAESCKARSRNWLLLFNYAYWHWCEAGHPEMAIGDRDRLAQALCHHKEDIKALINKEKRNATEFRLALDELGLKTNEVLSLLWGETQLIKEKEDELNS